MTGKTKKTNKRIVNERSNFRSYPDFLFTIEKNVKNGNKVEDWTHGLDTNATEHFCKVIFKDKKYITFFSSHGLWLKPFMRFLDKLVKQYPNESK